MRSVERDAIRVSLLFLYPSCESLRIGAVKQAPQAICAFGRELRFPQSDNALDDGNAPASPVPTFASMPLPIFCKIVAGSIGELPTWRSTSTVASVAGLWSTCTSSFTKRASGDSFLGGKSKGIDRPRELTVVVLAERPIEIAPIHLFLLCVSKQAPAHVSAACTQRTPGYALARAATRSSRRNNRATCRVRGRTHDFSPVPLLYGST